MKRDEVPYRLPGHRDASASATAAFALLAYPLSKDELMEAVGDWTIPLEGGARRVPLAVMMMNVPVDSFGSVEDAMRAFDQHWGREVAGL